jgi:hypothetical protein
MSKLIDSGADMTMFGQLVHLEVDCLLTSEKDRSYQQQSVQRY